MKDKRLTVRFPEELLEQIDETALKLERQYPGLRMKRSGLIRMLIEQALKQLPEESHV